MKAQKPSFVQLDLPFEKARKPPEQLELPLPVGPRPFEPVLPRREPPALNQEEADHDAA